MLSCLIMMLWYSTKWSSPTCVWSLFCNLFKRNLEVCCFVIFLSQKPHIDSGFQVESISSCTIHILLIVSCLHISSQTSSSYSCNNKISSVSHYLLFQWSERCFLSLSLSLIPHLLLFSWLRSEIIRNAFIRNACTSQCSCEDQICENASAGIKFNTR